MIENTVAWDTETALIAAGKLAPEMACVTWCGHDLVPGLKHWTEARDFLAELFETKQLVGQNVAFDSGVVCANFPDLMPLVFKAYEESRIVDTRLNQRLLDLAVGELDGFTDARGVFHKRAYSLDALSQRYGLGKMDKDTYRLRYGEFRDLPLEQWPEGAIEYAKTDALRTLQVFYRQLEREEFLKDAAAQARAAFALHLMSCVGITTDEKACRKFIAQTKDEIERARLTLVQAGLVDAAGKRKMKLAREYMEKTCHSLGLPVPKTKKGKDAKDDWKASTCLDAEACRDTGDEVLKAYSTYTSANTLIKKAEILLKGSQGIPLQTSFETLLETGRTSSRAPMPPMVGENLQNVRQAPGMRECFVARPGFVLGSIDFDMAELRTVSQICIWLFGYSTLADALNSGKDVHSMLGANLMGCTYEEMVANKKHGPYKKNRDHGKTGNFSFWGLSGVEAFVASVNKKAKNKEERIDVETGTRIKNAWKTTWLETKDYAAWTSRMVEQGAAYKSWITERVRANINYTTWANNGFQSLAADAAKSGLLPLAKECYSDPSSPLFGSRPLIFVHDEIIFEFREDRMHEAAFRARDIMVENFNRFVPDVHVTAEPTLMRCWTKGAQSVYDSNGRLIPWEESKAA